jgi:hypothetical protein
MNFDSVCPCLERRAFSALGGPWPSALREELLLKKIVVVVGPVDMWITYISN